MNSTLSAFYFKKCTKISEKSPDCYNDNFKILGKSYNSKFKREISKTLFETEAVA